MASFKLSRRGFLGSVGLGAGSAAISSCASPQPSVRFDHGVASGDPLTDRVILWTRVTPTMPAPGEIPVFWEVAADEAFSQIVTDGRAVTDGSRDFTVKVDAGGLSPDTHYWYRFRVGGVTGPVGRTRTLPAGAVDKIAFAVCSCSNYPQGFFHAYREMANEEDLNAVLHLGDYIYEYEDGRYSDDAMVEQGRSVVPSNEVISVADYRQRYALYRTDADLQAAHAAHPFIVVWDDHELANNTWKTGAENHQPETEGPFEERMRAAVQVYREWMPIRDPDGPGTDPKIYRTFEFGDLASLIMVDTRYIGRDEQLSYQKDMVFKTQAFDVSDPTSPKPIFDPAQAANLAEDAVKEVPLPFEMTEEGPKPILDFARIQDIDPANLPPGVIFVPDSERFAKDVLGNPDRSMLGATQEQWLAGQFAGSVAAGKAWQIVGAQLLMGRLSPPNLSPDDLIEGRTGFINADTLPFINALADAGAPFNLDAWDGYPVARERFYGAVAQTGADVITLAGDTHNGWAFNLADYQGQPRAVEFGTPGVSSPGMESYVPADPRMMEERTIAKNDELHWMNASDRGYMRLDVTAEEAVCSFRFVSTVKQQRYEAVAGPQFTVKKGARQIA